MKKLLCFVAVLLLTAAALPACAEQAEDAVDRLLNQLAAYFDAREQIYSLLYGCYQKVGAFYEREDYASLVRARLACSETSEKLREEEPPEMSLDAAVLLSLMQSGVDTSGLEDKVREMQDTLQSAAKRLNLLEGFLHSGAIFLKDGRKTGNRLIDSMAEGLSLEAEYDCCWLNDLLLPLGDDPRIADFWNRMPLRWPLIAQYREAWITASAQVTEKGAKILEDMEKALDEISTAFGMNAYSIQRYNQNSEAVEADFQWIAGMPPAIPLPDFWYSSENRSLHPNSGDTGGEGLPDTLIWRIPDISVEQFLTYVHQLSEIGFEGVLTGAAQDGWKNTLTVNGNICIIMYRTDSTVMIAYHPNQLTLEAR